jgi:citrate lyase subunit beta / citryl-CoA lyase
MRNDAGGTSVKGPIAVDHYQRIPGPALLFCPADRPDRYGKALAAADAVILDLEDGVGADRKDAARAALLAHPQDPARVIVRVSAVGAPGHEADLAALRQTAYTLVMLAKSESPGQFADLAGYGVIALVESSLGILRVEEIAQVPCVRAVIWGAEDLMASMRGRSSRHPGGGYRAVARHARSMTLLAATAHGKLAVDAIYASIGDLDGLAAEAEDAAASGFALKACIHPSHVPVIRAAFRADDKQAAWARRVLAAARSGGRDGGAVTVDGQMVDAPLIRQAEATLASLGE